MESKAPSAQEVSEYLKNLGWDSEKWTVLKEEEWQPLMKVSGYQNNMFDAVKDPAGRKMFDKNARIVERKWMNANMAAVAHAALPDAAPIPPPPPAPKVPEKLQEIADASPNVVIASIPPPPPPAKEEPKTEPVKEEVEWPGFVKTRALNLIAKGWKMKEGTTDMVESPEGKILGYEDLETMEDKEWTDMIKVTPKEEPKKEEAPVATEMPAETNSEKAEKRAIFLIKNGLKHSVDMTKLFTPDDTIISVASLGLVSDEDWMAMTARYTPKKIKDMQKAADEESSKAEQKDFEEAYGEEPSGLSVEEAVAKEDAADLVASESLQDESDNVVDLKGTIIDKETVEIEMEVEEDNLDKGTSVNLSRNEVMTTGDQGGLFHALAQAGFGRLNFSMDPLSEGKFQITVSMLHEDCDLETAQRFLAEVSKFKSIK